jgi:hypothetical protein
MNLVSNSHIEASGEDRAAWPAVVIGLQGEQHRGSTYSVAGEAAVTLMSSSHYDQRI